MGRRSEAPDSSAPRAPSFSVAAPAGWQSGLPYLCSGVAAEGEAAKSAQGTPSPRHTTGHYSHNQLRGAALIVLTVPHARPVLNAKTL